MVKNGWNWFPRQNGLYWRGIHQKIWISIFGGLETMARNPAKSRFALFSRPHKMWCQHDHMGIFGFSGVFWSRLSQKGQKPVWLWWLSKIYGFENQFWVNVALVPGSIMANANDLVNFFLGNFLYHIILQKIPQKNLCGLPWISV